MENGDDDVILQSFGQLALVPWETDMKGNLFSPLLFQTLERSVCRQDPSRSTLVSFLPSDYHLLSGSLPWISFSSRLSSMVRAFFLKF